MAKKSKDDNTIYLTLPNTTIIDTLIKSIEKSKDLDFGYMPQRFVKSFREWDNFNLFFLRMCFDPSDCHYVSRYTSLGVGRITSIQNEAEECAKSLGKKIAFLNEIIEMIRKLSKPNYEESKKTSDMDKNTEEIVQMQVFIVHGHDETSKVKVARFIERLGLKPIILHEQASSGGTVIEKIEQYSNVGFGIVIYTACDIGGKKSNEQVLKDRARQNVVFEHGYLIGKIGRKNVCALVRGNIETPTDVSGVVYIEMDDNDAWHISLARELKKSGYSVDMNKVL